MDVFRTARTCTFYRWLSNQPLSIKTPFNRFGHSQAAVGKSIYVFGGRMGTSIDEKLLDDLWAFDTDSKTWSEVDAKDKESAPSPRSFHTSVVVGECIYIFGGCPKEGRQADLHRFDTRTKRNSQL